ncbi:AraC family transcriptional regulator [Chitinophaga ginsengisegetis]|uniref:AraC family transcriptional regulator n=1 Tax=Chitinophaga ginsengisegetis TaxID=393003 RepID=UPI000DB8FC19|nr:helix-turn-helix domain-containing protein [Chitinophaga ginsengisegetis]MDR6570784.1 AraC-like DNA-binding protein [Chitinophaga ginsengisegetis]MDR6650518.1 AraC-like DNA-binding protein [Chitinophaga ginsengisegetis]MDR6656843.1 AraC-like DNA-binding protein [Chitinophaga ginsengisegetis]
MNQICHLSPINLSDATSLDTMVEHRRVFNLQHCELNIFETFHRCSNVALSYNGLVVSSMMRGKKIMSLSGSEEFFFLPGESVILPEGVSMKVDFPEADERHPVQCATLALDWDMVNKNLAFLNEQYPNREAPFEWQLNFSRYHFLNNKELAASMNKLIGISMESDPAKDALADLSLKFLLLRIIQTQNLVAINDVGVSDHRFTPALQYIKEHLTQKITIDVLAKVSCMSRSVFFQAFKEQYGISPLEYILRERIRQAKQIMADPALSITDVCYQSGFNNLNYFIKLFKRAEGITPREYRK